MSVCPFVTVSVTSTWPEGRSPAPPSVHQPLWERPASPPTPPLRGLPQPCPKPQASPTGPWPKPMEARESCVAAASVGAAEGSPFFPNLFLAGGDSLQCWVRRVAGWAAGGGEGGLQGTRAPVGWSRGLSSRVSPGHRAKRGGSDVSTRIPPTILGSQRPGCAECPGNYAESFRRSPAPQNRGCARMEEEMLDSACDNYS